MEGFSMSIPKLDLDLNFRPQSYFWPMNERSHVVSAIKGAERRAYVERMIAEGREAELPPDLLQSNLRPEELRATIAVHPSFMGGEYLPDRQEKEIEIARITIASVTQDVTCIYASRVGDDFTYRTVDEYEGDTLTEARACSSRLPLTVNELTDFFLQAWDLLMVLDMNFGSDGRRADEVRAFFWGSSEFYPGFKALIAHRVEEWLKPQLAALAEEERDDE
jgi:hypothetical protein